MYTYTYTYLLCIFVHMVSETKEVHQVHKLSRFFQVLRGEFARHCSYGERLNTEPWPCPNDQPTWMPRLPWMP